MVNREWRSIIQPVSYKEFSETGRLIEQNSHESIDREQHDDK